MALETVVLSWSSTRMVMVMLELDQTSSVGIKLNREDGPVAMIGPYAPAVLSTKCDGIQRGSPVAVTHGGRLQHQKHQTASVA
jgi:predicted metal-binding membrane protein